MVVSPPFHARGLRTRLSPYCGLSRHGTVWGCGSAGPCFCLWMTIRTLELIPLLSASDRCRRGRSCSTDISGPRRIGGPSPESRTTWMSPRRTCASVGTAAYEMKCCCRCCRKRWQKLCEASKRVFRDGLSTRSSEVRWCRGNTRRRQPSVTGSYRSCVSMGWCGNPFRPRTCGSVDTGLVGCARRSQGAIWLGPAARADQRCLHRRRRAAPSWVSWRLDR